MPESEAYKNPEMIYLNTVANLYTKIGADAGGSGLAGTDRGLYDLNTFCADDAILRQEVVTGTMVDCGEICSLITGV